MPYPTKKLGEVLKKSGVIPAKVKRDEYQEKGKYPVVDQGENFIAGYIDDDKKLYRGNLPVVIFGDHTRIVKYIDFPFAVGADGTKILRPQKIILPKFFYYALLLKPVQNFGYKRHFSILKQQNIAVPFLPTQKQIVERLDKIAEAQKLNNELIQKADELFQSLLHKELNPADKEWEVKKLGEVLDYEQPTKYIVSSTDYKDGYPTPVLTAGKSFILGYTNESDGTFPKEKLPVIIFDDFTTASKFVDFPFKVKSSAMKILHAKKDGADINFMFYTIQTIKFTASQHKRYWISEYSKIQVPVPSLKTQKQIVAKLSAVQDYKSRLMEQKYKLKELFNSVLHKSMNPR